MILAVLDGGYRALAGSRPGKGAELWDTTMFGRVAYGLIVAVGLCAPSWAADIWYQDNNLGRGGGMPADFVEKFRKPETFAQATKHIRVYMIRFNVVSQLGDAFFTDLFFPYLRKNNIKLAINTGGATWAQANARRRRVFDESVDGLRRIKKLGGKVAYISLQSILSKPFRRGEVEYPMDKRIQDAVAYAKAARKVFRDVAIGIMDALPSHAKDYRGPYRALRDALARAGIGLSYIHLDIPFDIPAAQRRGVTWQSLRTLESYVEDDLGVAFGILAKSRRGGQHSSRMSYERTMSTLECYAGVGGTPREYVLAGNFRYPERTIPENATGDNYPQMRVMLNFGRRLAEIKKSGVRPSDGWRARCGIRR